MDTDYDVVVVGYGPSGLVAASALGRRGHRVAVVEKWQSLYGLPRLTHIDGETARIIQNVGDIDTALQGSSPAETYRWCNGSGEELLALDWSGESCGYAAHYTMYQPDIEDAIDDAVKELPNVDVFQGWTVTQLDQDRERVALRISPWSKSDEHIAESAGGREITALYVIGADGANSFVRTSLGIGRDDLHSDDVWLNIDTEKLRELPERFAVSSQFCDPERPNMFMPIGTRRHRFEVAVLPGEDHDAAMDPDYAWTWLREHHALGPEDVRILRRIVYVFSARMADRWREGRVFLAGDAAHTMPPYMGQGACSGMRDGFTLAWKLDLVLSGRADPSFLDTYEEERRPHVRAIQKQSVELGRVANLKDPEAAAARDEAFRGGDVPPPPPFPVIDSGFIAAGTQLAGRLTPQGMIALQGRRGLFDDVVGNVFSLVTAEDPRSVLGDEQLAVLEDLGVVVITLADGTPWTIEDLEGTYARFFAESGTQAVLARPDFVAFGAGTLSDLPHLVGRFADALQRVPA